MERQTFDFALAEGKSHMGPDGFRWRYGVPRQMTEGDPYFDHYKGDPRFQHQMVRQPAADAPPGSPAPKVVPKSRAEIQAERKEREAQQRAEAQERKREEEEAKAREEEEREKLEAARVAKKAEEDEVDPDDDPDDDDGEEGAEPPKYSKTVLTLARKEFKPTTKLDQLLLVAQKLGVKDIPDKAEKSDLLKLITQRQAEILADLGT